MKNQKRNRLIYTENVLTVARREMGDGQKKFKGLRTTDWLLQNSHGDVKL